MASKPSVASLSMTSGCRITLLISRFKSATTGSGARVGASTPEDRIRLLIRHRPASVRVGTSGSADESFAVATARQRSLPSFTSGTAGVIAENPTGAWPASTD